jgi:hypothetical protein
MRGPADIDFERHECWLSFLSPWFELLMANCCQNILATKKKRGHQNTILANCPSILNVKDGWRDRLITQKRTFTCMIVFSSLKRIII